jgi:hypothetical protein
MRSFLGEGSEREGGVLDEGNIGLVDGIRVVGQREDNETGGEKHMWNEGTWLTPEYRSGIFTHSAEQEEVAKAVTAEVQDK